MTPTSMTHRRNLHMVPMGELVDTVADALASGWRLGALTARHYDGSSFALIAVLINPETGKTRISETPLAALPNPSPDASLRLGGDAHSHKEADEKEQGWTFPSLTPRVPQAHWFERAIFDFFGLHPAGHPQLKSLILHEAWPAGFHPLGAESPLRSSSHQTGGDANSHDEPGTRELPAAKGPATGVAHETNDADGYSFLQVKGDGVYEIPVGPIHAGIIEPGHFRFSCLGEVIQNLEIRLGYQHRGIEEQLARTPWRMARFLAESASSDTTVGNAMAHAMAIEDLLGIDIPENALALRAVALEIERVASHIGDLGGICSDIGYAGGAAVFSRLRGSALGLGERLTGSRFQTAYVVPGGVARPLSEPLRLDILDETAALAEQFAEAEHLVTDNSGALERMEGVGKVRTSLAKDFGLVGPAARACGIAYDVRQALRQAPYDSLTWSVATADGGDVLGRVLVRVQETKTSLEVIRQLLTGLPRIDDTRISLPDALPANRVGLGVVEAWRGELIHVIFTDWAGEICRYAIKDPSLNNWTGLAVAVRHQLVSDFPLCNKSFSLSYSGNDL